MKVLITDRNGIIINYLIKELNSLGGFDVFFFDDDLDVTNKSALYGFVRKIKPDIIIHNLEYSDVEKAEKDQVNALLINELTTKFLAELAVEINAKIVYISTAYVFSGTKNTPYEVHDDREPLSIYGHSKNDGEKKIRKCPKHFIIRTSWLFDGKNDFVSKVLNMAKTSGEVVLDYDQVGSPTYAGDLAKLICQMIQTDRYGTYHATNEGSCSIVDFAKGILSSLNIKANVTVKETSGKQLGIHPLNITLSKNSLIDRGFSLLPSWEESLTNSLK